MKITSLLLLLSSLLIGMMACQSTETNNQPGSAENTVGLLQHTVYFYLNDDVTPEEVEQFESGLEGLLEIEAIYKAEMGIPGSTDERDVTDHSFAFSIFTWFETLEDYRVYDEHPDHLEFINAYNHLWSEVKVYDSDLTYSR